MGADSKIQWTHHTFNPWWGCARVSPGCEHCYAEAFAKRTGKAKWGVKEERRTFGAAHWKEPHKWNAAAAKVGERHRVFCASMADVFEDREDLEEERNQLWETIQATPHLDWLLLTKRPENFARLLPWGEHGIGQTPWRNVWLGTTVEDQKRADERVPHLLGVPAVVRFLSCEPLLMPVDLTRVRDDELGARWNALEAGIDWVIVGGESGPGARAFDASWAHAIVEQCRAASVPVFVKQMGAHVVDRNDRFDTCDDTSVPTDWWPWGARDPGDIEENIHGFREDHQGALVRLKLLDRKGGNMDEWPVALRVREFPSARTTGIGDRR